MTRGLTFARSATARQDRQGWRGRPGGGARPLAIALTILIAAPGGAPLATAAPRTRTETPAQMPANAQAAAPSPAQSPREIPSSTTGQTPEAAQGAPMPTGAATQDVSLSDAVARAIARNRDLRVERESTIVAEAGIDRARAAYDPTLRGELRYRDAKLPVTSLLSGAPEGELAPHQRGIVSSASFTKLFGTGATASLSGSIARDATNNFITLLSPAWTSSIGVEFRQPLLQNRQIDPARRAIKVAHIGRERSALALRRALLDTVSAVEQAYWTLVAAQRDIVARRRGVALAEEQRTDVAARIDAKVTPESDIAQPTAEIARRQGDLYAADEARLRAERALKLLILDGPNDPLWDVELRAADAPEVLISAGGAIGATGTTSPTGATAAGAATTTTATPGAIGTTGAIDTTHVDLQAALRDAQQHRPELADAAARVRLQDVEIEAAKDRLKPQLDLVAGYTSRGLAGSLNPDAKPFGGLPLVVPEDLDGGLGSSIDSLARRRFPDASVGLALTVPLGQRAARADVATAESGRRQAIALQEKDAQRVAVEVRNAVTALQTARQRLDAARAGRDAAQVQLQAEQDRFGAGITTTFLVLTRQNDLVAAEVAESAALAAYRRALAELARARGTLLRDRQIDVQ